MKKINVIIFFFVFIIGCENKSVDEQQINIDEKQALKIAELELVNTYGEKVLQQKPFKKRIENNIWKISGTPHCPTSNICLGGVAEIEIDGKTGKVLNLRHGK